MKRFLIALVVIAGLTGLSLFLYRHFFHVKENANELVLFGNVDVRQVNIGFRVAGQVSKLYFEEGDTVTPGALMAEVDESPYDSQAAQAAFNVETLKASLENAKILLNRRQELISDGGVSQEDLDNAKSSYDQLSSELSAAISNLAVARDNLRFTKVYAPNEGVILTRIREPGTVVRESDPVYTLSLTNPVWIRAFIDEENLGQVKNGMEAEVFTDNPKGRSYIGRVGFISPIAEFTPKTVETAKLRTDLVYRLRIYVDHPDSGLRQGMPVTVRLKVGEKSSG